MKQSFCNGSTTPRWTGEVQVTENRKIAEKTWRISLKAPDFIPLISSGQFVMLRLIQRNDPLLGRPFAIYSIDLQTETVDIVYLTVGKMTQQLTEIRPGDRLELWGPLGNGWNEMKKSWTRSNCPEHLIMVAGGIGQTPFYLLSQEILAENQNSEKAIRTFPSKLSLLFGAQTKSRFSCLDDFERLGIDVHLTTEDGSAGQKGLITSIIPNIVEKSGCSEAKTVIAACGPHPLLKAVALLAQNQKMECWTSLESSMACGLGICFSCVIKYRDDQGQWDYRRTCVDGPVFNAARLCWD
ncbi:MAG: dihydroorotate dehydrogenase electron transfer subunit [Planctomycetia bacterium]|nr:dihydroorotate dehydrogenase electron transfer subunit [Planctomycetia bacterium]